MSELLDKERRLMTGSEPLDGNGPGRERRRGWQRGARLLPQEEGQDRRQDPRARRMEREGGWVGRSVDGCCQAVRVVCQSYAAEKVEVENARTVAGHAISLDFHRSHPIRVGLYLIICYHPCNQ